jgi:hypothetical protein
MANPIRATRNDPRRMFKYLGKSAARSIPPTVPHATALTDICERKNANAPKKTAARAAGPSCLWIASNRSYKRLVQIKPLRGRGKEQRWLTHHSSGSSG